MRKMDRMLPKGNPSISSSSEGAFERFLTAAIATIITIIFSWRMLDKINEEREEDEYEPERHKLGHASSLSQTSFVALSPTPQERASLNYLSLGETSRFQSHSAESHNAVSLSERASRGEFNTGGFRFQLETIIRVPVDFPLCGDGPERSTRMPCPKNSQHAEASGNPGDSKEVFKLGLTRDSDNQLLDCFIDRTSPGAGQVGDTQQQHDPAITANRSLPLLQQPTDGLDSRTERQTSCRNNLDTSTATNRNSISDSSLEYIPNDLTDLTDSSIEEAGYTCNENNSDLFLNASNDCGGDDDRNGENQDFIAEEEITTPLHTTDDTDVDEPRGDDYFIALSDGGHHHFDQGYDWDDDVQPRELDSDEELFCCSILEPIIEEDSDDITTSSEGDNSRSDKSSNKFQYDLNFVSPREESLSSETLTSNFECSAQLEVGINQDDVATISNEQYTKLADRKCATEVTNQIPDPDINNARLQNINTVFATDPDYNVSIRSESSSVAHTVQIRAELFTPAVNNRANENCASEENHSENIRWIGSSVDRFFSNSVIERAQEDNSRADLDNRLHQIDVDKIIDNAEDDSVFGKQFVPSSFIHTFSTRVEVEDSNSESDESVQTVISRKTSGDLQGSPQHGSYLTSGVRPAQETNKRPYSDGVLYSSKRWIAEESRDVNRRLRNVSEGGGVAFGEEDSSVRLTVDSLPGRSNFNLQSYKSFTAQDLPTLTDESFDSKLDNVLESSVTGITGGGTSHSEFSNIDFGHPGQKANKHGRNNVVIGTVHLGEETDQPDNVVCAKETINSHYEETYEKYVNHKFSVKETFQGEIITGLTDRQLVYSDIYQDNKDTGMMDAPSRWAGYNSEEESRGEDNNKMQDDEDWEEEVIEETFVLPLPPERNFVNALQRVRSMFDESESDRSSQILSRNEDDNNEEDDYQSTCVTKMIEVDGYGALGFTGNDDFTSGYRDQCSELESTDRGVKGKMGFKLNLDKYKSDKYVTESGWPIMRYVEKERVYIDDSVPSNKTREQGEDMFGDTSESYIKDDLNNHNKRESEIASVDKEKLVNKMDQQQEDNEEEEAHYVEEHIEIFRMKNYQFGREAFESDRTRPLGWRDDDSERTFYENRSTFYQPSSPGQYTLFGTNTETRVRNSQQLPEMTSSDNLYATLTEDSGNVPKGNEEIYSPYTNTAHTYPGPFSQSSSRDVFSQSNAYSFPSFVGNNTHENNPSSHHAEDISRNIFTKDDTQGTSSFTNNVRQENSQSSNYDEFVRHILSKDIKLQTMEGGHTQVSPSQTGSILSGNVTSSETQKSSFAFPENENLPQENVIIPSTAIFTEKYNTRKEEARGSYRSSEGDNTENKEQEIVKKPKFVRTSTAQEEEELLKFKPYEEKQNTVSFEELKRQSVELERSNSRSSGVNRNTGNDSDNEARTRATSISSVGIKPSLSEYTHFPSNSRLYNFSEPFSEPWLETAPAATSRLSSTYQVKSPIAENVMTKYPFVESPPTKPLSPEWARVDTRPNFMEEISTTSSSVSEPRISSDPFRITVGNRNTQIARDVNRSDKPVDMRAENATSSPAVKPFAFTQATISLTSTLNTVPSASMKTPTAHKISEKTISQENDLPKISDLRLPLVSSSAFKYLQERTSQTSMLDRKDRSNLAHFQSEEANPKVETANAKEEKRISESRNVYYKGGNKDNEPEASNSKDNDRKTATTKHNHTNSETAEKSFSLESTDDILPLDSSSASGTASSTTSFDSVEPTLSSTHARLSAPATTTTTTTTTTVRPVPPNPTYCIPDLPKKPKTLKEIKKRYKQPYKSILTQDPTVFSPPKAAPFVVPDHLITPSRMKILQARNQFLSEQNLHTDPFAGEFTAHKESLTLATTASTSKDRKYTPRMYKQSTYRSQEQLEKILYMVNLKPGGSEGSLNVDCLHDDCILSEAGRREILDKKLSIDNLDARLHSRLGNIRSYINGPMSDSFDPETNSDLFDLTFPFPQLDRPASMGELRHASDYTTLSGSGTWALTSPGSRYQDYVSQKQNKKSKSLGTLETKEDTDDFEVSTTADGLHRPPSAHELRISKSLQKLHVPDWYKHVSISKGGNFLPRCRSAISVNSRGTSASLASSPSTTPSISSNVVIKSRVQFPTTARNLRSPHVPSKSAPTTPSLTSWVDAEGKTTPTPVKLPSESMRTADKPTSLMPIPILPLDRIRFIVEKKKELARNDKTEAHQTFSSSISHSSTVSHPQTVTPASPSPTDSFDTNGYNEDENPEEVIPEVIVSPTDPSVRSILKRPISERKGWGAQTPLEPKADYSKVKTDLRRVQEFAPTMTLFQAPVYSSHTYDQLKQQVTQPVFEEMTTLVEQPADIEIKQEHETVNYPQLLYNSGEDEHFISRNEEEEWRPLSVTRRSPQQASLSSSSSSSVEETESKTQRLQDNKKQQNLTTSFDSPEVFPETQDSMLSPATATFPPTILVTPDTPRPAGSHYVNIVVVEPTTPVAILERAPIIRPPDNKPFIAPVIEDHSIIDTPPYFTEYSTQHVPRTWSRSSESFHESEINNSFDRQDISSKPIETQAEPRTWSRSSESFHESDPDNSFNRNEIPHKPVQAQTQPRTWSRSSESFRESDPNNSYDRQNIPLKPVQSQAQPRTWSRSSESFHESDVNNSFDRQDIPSKPVQTQAQPRTWSRSSESFRENDPNKFFNRKDIPSKRVQTDAGPEKKRTWVPKPKPNRKLRSSREFDNDTTETEYTNTPQVLKSKLQKHESVDKFQRLRSPVESESQEESALSEESSSENRFKIKDKQVMYYPHVATPTTRETDPERSSDSYSSRSTHTFQDLAQEDLYEPGTVNRTAMIQSNPNFRRSLDRVLDRYTSQDEDQPGDVSERDTESITPTENPNRSIDSVRDREYPVSNGVTTINDLRQAENTNDNYNWDARSFINGALRGNRQDYTRSVLDYNNQDGDFNNTDYNGSDSRQYGKVQYERRKSVNEDIQPEYNRRDRIVDRNNIPRQHSQDIASAEDLTYSVDSEQDSIREYPNFSSAPGDAVRNWTMPSNWTMPGNSKSHMDLSERYDEPVTQRKPGRTWQPKPKRGRGLKHSVVKHAFSTGDILNKSSVASLESKVSPEASPYKYKVAGSAFSSTKPDARAGLITPPSERHESMTSSNETTV